jgi:hypothetical protein
MNWIADVRFKESLTESLMLNLGAEVRGLPRSPREERRLFQPSIILCNEQPWAFAKLATLAVAMLRSGKVITDNITVLARYSRLATGAPAVALTISHSWRTSMYIRRSGCFGDCILHDL